MIQCQNVFSILPISRNFALCELREPIHLSTSWRNAVRPLPNTQMRTVLYLLQRRSQTLSAGKKPAPQTEPLVLISPTKLHIGECDGSVKIQEAEDTFFPKTHFDIVHGDVKELMNESHNVPSAPAHARVYGLQRNATLAEMFKQLHTNPRKLCFTEHQIVEFVREHKDWLIANDFCTTFFPFSFAHGRVGVVAVIFDTRVSRTHFAFYSYAIWNMREWSINFERRLVVKAPPYK